MSVLNELNKILPTISNTATKSVTKNPRSATIIYNTVVNIK